MINRKDLTYQADRTRINSRRRTAKTAATITAVGGVGGLTLNSNNPRWLAAGWLIGGAVFVLADGLHYFDRYLARQSRGAVAASMALAGVAVLTVSMHVALLAGVTAFISMALIKSLNKRWLEAETWKYTEVGYKARSIDPGDEAALMWQADGARECRGMLSMMGHNYSHDTLHGIMQAVWIAGYLYRKGKEQADDRMIKALQDSNRDYQARLARLQKEYASYKENVTAYSSPIEEYKARERTAWDAVRRYEGENAALQDEIAKLRQAVNRQQIAQEMPPNPCDTATRNGADDDGSTETDSQDPVKKSLTTSEKMALAKKFLADNPGSSQAAAARSVGWTPSYFSQLLKKERLRQEAKEKKKPRVPTTTHEAHHAGQQAERHG